MTFLIGTPQTKNAGYYRNDDRPSGGAMLEGDVQTCTHCQAVLIMGKWKDDGGFCGRCMAPICGPCADRMQVLGCEPFLKKLEAELDALVKYRQHLKVAGLDEPAAKPQPFTGLIRS